MIRLSKSAAIQFAGDGIRSNCILPGPVLTPMQDRWQDRPDLQDQVAAAVPLGRLGQAGDIAEAALFLLSGARAISLGRS